MEKNLFWMQLSAWGVVSAIADVGAPTEGKGGRVYFKRTIFPAKVIEGVIKRLAGIQREAWDGAKP